MERERERERILNQYLKFSSLFLQQSKNFVVRIYYNVMSFNIYLLSLVLI